jgi:hypothetical protein
MGRKMAVVRSSATFAAYLGISVLFFGRGVIAAPADRVVGDAGTDKTIYMWGLEWFPHAIASGVDPLYARVIWAPHGTDLAWVTDVPGAAVLAWPVTHLFGPVVAYNLLTLAAPAATAFTTFVLVRWITGCYWPSVVAGYLFGFSSFHVLQTTTHLHLTLTFLIPVGILLVLKRFAGELGGARFILLLSLALAGQFLFSLEVFVLLVLVGGIGAIAAWLVLPRRERARLRETAVGAGIALAFALLLVSPYVVHALFVATTAAQPVRSPFRAAADLLNFIVPTRRTWLRPPGGQELVERFSATGVERGAYLGLPLLVVLGFFGRRRSAPRSVLLLVLAALMLASLGPRIRVAGVVTIPGPWLVPAHLPVLDGIKPVRLTLFVGLCAALACGIWLAEERQIRWRWALAGLAVVALLPNPSHALWTASVPRSTFFSSGRWKQHVRGDEIALVLPYGAGGWSMLWQAEAGLRPRLVGGHIGRRTTVREERWRDVYEALAGYPTPTISPERFRAFVSAHDVAAVIVTPGTRLRTRKLVQTLHIRGATSGEAIVYRVGVGGGRLAEVRGR